jgi:predicted HicB family RNase H-like nuclease
VADKDGYERIPHRTIRVPEDEWRAAQEAARRRGESLSEVIRASLRRYVKRSA